MLKTITQLECVVEGKTCRFQCDVDTPITFAKESMFQFLKYIGQIEDDAKAKLAQQEAEKEKQDTPQGEIPSNVVDIPQDQTG